jgi:hypothetical protein
VSREALYMIGEIGEKSTKSALTKLAAFGAEIDYAMLVKLYGLYGNDGDAASPERTLPPPLKRAGGRCGIFGRSGRLTAAEESWSHSADGRSVRV